MDWEFLRLRRRHHASLHPLCLLSLTTVVSDKASVKATQRLSQEHDDQALTDPDPVAHLLVLHIVWQSSAASIHEFHPTGGHGNVLSVHPKSDLHIVGMKVTYVTSLPAARADLKQTALRVCSEGTPLTDVTSVPVHFKFLHDSVAPHNTSVCLLKSCSSCSRLSSALRAGTSCSQDHVPALCGRVLFQCSHRASHRCTSLLVTPASHKVHSCILTQLHCHMASVPMQHHRNKQNRQRIANQTRTLSSGTSALMVHTASSASEVVDASQS